MLACIFVDNASIFTSSQSTTVNKETDTMQQARYTKGKFHTNQGSTLAKYAKATQAHASLASIPTMDQSTKKRLSQQKVGKKDNSCLPLGCNSTLFSPSQPRQHQGSYPYVDCCLLLSQPNDALRPSSCRLPITGLSR